MKKLGFTKTQITIIESVEKFLKTDDSLANAVVMTANELGFHDRYIIDTYNSYRKMVSV